MQNESQFAILSDLFCWSLLERWVEKPNYSKDWHKKEYGRKLRLISVMPIEFDSKLMKLIALYHAVSTLVDGYRDSRWIVLQLLVILSKCFEAYCAYDVKGRYIFVFYASSSSLHIYYACCSLARYRLDFALNRSAQSKDCLRFLGKNNFSIIDSLNCMRSPMELVAMWSSILHSAD